MSGTLYEGVLHIFYDSKPDKPRFLQKTKPPQIDAGAGETVSWLTVMCRLSGCAAR